MDLIRKNIDIRNPKCALCLRKASTYQKTVSLFLTVETKFLCDECELIKRIGVFS